MKAGKKVVQICDFEADKSFSKISKRFSITMTFLNPLMHNCTQSGRTSVEKGFFLLLKYLLTCDHFMKVCIKGLIYFFMADSI